MAQHQLAHANVDAVREQATRALLTQVVPMQVDLPQLGSIDTSAGFARFVS